MLATRISFMNELALLADKVGADIEQVRRGIGSDPRIGTHFLYPGTGYGGSCFPKDVKALIHTGRENGLDLGVLQAVEAANERQKHVLVAKVVQRFGEDLSAHTFAMWGLAFKPNTDDMRDAPSRVICEELSRRGATLRAYDPVAMDEAARVMKTAAAPELRQKPGRSPDGCRRVGGGHGVEGIPQPRLRPHQGHAQAAAGLRWPQHLRPGAPSHAGRGIPRHRPGPEPAGGVIAATLAG